MNQRVRDTKVSIVIPIYNTKLYLEQCVRSLMVQTHKNIEYIFIDDASTDGCLDLLQMVLAEYPERSGQWVILQNDENRGVAYCRSRSMKCATGDYLIHVDSDDYVDIKFIERLVTKAVETGSDMVICNTADVNGDIVKNNKIGRVTERSELIKRLLIGTFHSSLWNKMIRRSIIIENDLFPDEKYRILEDKSVVFKMVYFSRKIEFIDEPLYYYRKYGNSLTKENQRVLIPMLKWVMRDVDDFFAVNPDDETIEDGIKIFKVGVAASLLIYEKDAPELPALRKQIPFSLIKMNTYIPAYYRVALYSSKLHQGWVVALIRFIIEMRLKDKARRAQ